MTALTLDLVGGELAICRLDPDAPVPAWAVGPPLCSITRTPAELSLVVAEAQVVDADCERVERGWRALVVAGPLAFDLSGILASLTAPLAAAGVPVFSVSTFDTDWLLVREADLTVARDALRAAGHGVGG